MREEQLLVSEALSAEVTDWLSPKLTVQQHKQNVRSSLFCLDVRSPASETRGYSIL